MMSSQHPIGALSHLVEAATALTKLVDAPRSQDAVSSAKVIKPRSVVSDDDEERRRIATKQALRVPREIFPQRLMAILADTALSDIVSWLPHGRSFVIIRPDVFSETVLPKYFPSNDSRTSTKYPSFTRKLNRWGFRQATRGPDTGAFHHPLFRRDQPNLCLDMVCQKSRKRPSGSSGKNKGAATTEEANKLSESSVAHITTLQRAVSERKPWNPAASQETLVDFPSGGIVSNTSESIPKPVATVTPPPPITPPATGDTNKLAGAQTSHRSEGPYTPYIPSDPGLVAAALRARDEMEKIKVAKSMLYDAYMKALHGQPNA